MFFSERNGHEARISEIVQLDSLDEVTRTMIWNYLYRSLIHPNEPSFSWDQGSQYIHRLSLLPVYRLIWSKLLHRSVDELDEFSYKQLKEFVKSFIERAEWHLVLGFLEAFRSGIKQIRYADWYYFDQRITEEGHLKRVPVDFDKQINAGFEQFKVGYRLVEGQFVPITSDQELEAIRKAVGERSYDGVSSHLKQALEHYADRDNPDYRNSVKESISAVESLCRHITGQSTLDSALKKIEAKVSINSQFKEGLKKLYHYTNDKTTGARHALLDSSTPPDATDARYMLVTCSAFVNYLIDKTKSVEIDSSSNA